MKKLISYIRKRLCRHDFYMTKEVRIHDGSTEYIFRCRKCGYSFVEYDH